MSYHSYFLLSYKMYIGHKPQKLKIAIFTLQLSTYIENPLFSENKIVFWHVLRRTKDGIEDDWSQSCCC